MIKNFATFQTNELNLSEFDENGCLRKQALVFVEGDQTDNQGRVHSLTSDRLQNIAQNTQSFFTSGSNIPVLKDHKKDVENTVGSVEGEWIARPIQKEDIIDDRYSNMIGKMGLFTNNVILKSKDVIKKAKDGIVKTISPGLDFVSDTIKEISLTPMPAIKGMGLFSEPLTWEELQQTQQTYDQLRQHNDELYESFFQLMKNILDSENIENKEQYLMNAIEGYAQKIMELLEINPEMMEYQQTPQQPMKQYQMGNQVTNVPENQMSNRQLIQQQLMGRGNQNFNEEGKYAKFSISGLLKNENE